MADDRRFLRRCAAWILTSWALSATHLGMLEQHRSIGAANAITLLRANLHALVDHRCTAVAALVTDLADGRVARRRGTVSPFGAAADSLADAAFWLYFAQRHEPPPSFRPPAWLTWAAPVAAVTAASVLGGQML